MGRTGRATTSVGFSRVMMVICRPFGVFGGAVFAPVFE
jgi:hypothetical protein